MCSDFDLFSLFRHFLRQCPNAVSKLGNKSENKTRGFSPIPLVRKFYGIFTVLNLPKSADKKQRLKTYLNSGLQHSVKDGAVIVNGQKFAAVQMLSL